MWKTIPPRWRVEVPAADENEFIGMAVDHNTRDDFAMHVLHFCVPVLGLTSLASGGS